MLNYELFKESITNKILDFMPDEYENYEVRIGSVRKVNQTLDCLNLIPKGEKDWVATPNIYIEHMYEEFKQHGDLNKSLEKMAYIINYSFKNLKPQIMPKNISELKHTLVMALINTKDNKEMLENAPHRKFLDLSVIYRCMVPASNGELGTVLVDYNFMDMLNLTQEELYEISIKNTKKLLPVKIKRLDDIIGEMMELEGNRDKDSEEYTEESKENKNEYIEEKSNLYVISNDIGINGAVSMTYEEELYKLAEELNSDLYILPSSVHEVIAVPCGREDVDWLKELVRSVNDEQVVIEERLSYNVYQYSRERRKILIASKKSNSLN